METQIKFGGLECASVSNRLTKNLVNKYITLEPVGIYHKASGKTLCDFIKECKLNFLRSLSLAETERLYDTAKAMGIAHIENLITLPSVDFYLCLTDDLVEMPYSYTMEGENPLKPTLCLYNADINALDCVLLKDVDNVGVRLLFRLVDNKEG